MNNETVSIRPSVGYLSILQAINYRAWYAMAEFVDNSLQSYLQNKTKLRKFHGPNFKLKIAIYVTPTKIQIVDNAAGITKQDFSRAFRAISNLSLSDFFVNFSNLHNFLYSTPSS